MNQSGWRETKKPLQVQSDFYPNVKASAKVSQTVRSFRHKSGVDWQPWDSKMVSKHLNLATTLMSIADSEVKCGLDAEVFERQSASRCGRSNRLKAVHGFLPGKRSPVTVDFILSNSENAKKPYFARSQYSFGLTQNQYWSQICWPMCVLRNHGPGQDDWIPEKKPWLRGGEQNRVSTGTRRRAFITVRLLARQPVRSVMANVENL